MRYSVSFKKMKYTKYLAVCLVAIFPILVSAETSEVMSQIVQFEDNSRLLESLSLWATLIIASVTSAMVWASGRTMRGGVFGKVLTYFSIGMTLVFLGFVTEVPWFKGVEPLYLKLAHSSLYTMGYIFMGIAAHKLLWALKGK